MKERCIPIYLVSLESDLERRERLAAQFPEHYGGMIHVNAVNGRELSARQYYEKNLRYVASTGKIMSPSELGCTLSHIRALELFVASGESRALILEDDVLGDDASLRRIDDIARGLAENSLLICGGQDGLKKRKYLLGKSALDRDVFRLTLFSHKYVFRACCYVVTQTTAKIILQKHSREVVLADNWGYFFPEKEVSIYFSNLLKHPVDLSDSHIEKDRARVRGKRFSGDGFSSSTLDNVVARAKRKTLAAFWRMMGNRRLVD